MTKLYPLPLIILIIALLAGCNNSQATPPAESVLPKASPTVTPSATEVVKPLQGQTQPPQLAGDAPLIAYNQVKEGELTADNAVDEWSFTATAGERVNIVLNSQFDSYLELFGPDGRLLTSSDDSSTSLNAALFDHQIEQDGPHLVKVYGYGNGLGQYALALTGGHPTVGGGQIAAGESRQVVLSERGMKWQYQGQPERYLSVSVTGQTGVDPVLSVFGPDGVLLMRDDDSGGNLNPEISDMALPAAGAYTIRAHTIGNTGLITLTVNDSDRLSGGGPLTIGQSHFGTLKPGRNHMWNFSGEQGQILNIVLTSPDFDPFLELRNAQDEIIAENDDSDGSTNARLEGVVLPASDSYTVVARAHSSTGGGDYELLLKPVKVAAGGGPLAIDERQTAALTPGQTDTWLFEAEAGSYVTLNTESTQFDTYLELRGPEGVLLVEDDDGSGGLNAGLLNFPIDQDGEYQVEIRSARPQSDEGGVYAIELNLSDELASSGILQAGEQILGELTAGEQHTWTFEAQEDELVTAAMESDTLDTYLSLYNDEGVLLYVNDDFFGKQAAIDNFIVPADGRYRIVARDYTLEESGRYTLTFDISLEVQPLTPLPDDDQNETAAEEEKED